MLDDFFRRLQQARRGLLMLDYDGTLAPFHRERMQALPEPAIVETLEAIQRGTGTRLAFVTGRPCREIPLLLPSLGPVEVWGCHGREYHQPGMGIVSFGVTQEDEQLLEEARALSWRVLKTVPEAALAHSESKTGCEAIHWRPLAAPERAVVAEVARKLWSPLLGEGKAQIDLFDGGIEFSITGRTKGEAVRHLLEAWDWEAHPAAFLGDDLTDENGFRELLGKGLPVLVRNEPRETLAPLRLRLPEGVLDFLQRWEAAL